jgi:hypothetical protein
VRDDRPGDGAGEVGRVDPGWRNALAVVGCKHRLEHAVFADPLDGDEDQRVVSFGAGVERAVERLHDVLRADHGQILRRVRLGVGAGIGREPAVEAGDAVPVRRASIQSFSSSKMWSSASVWREARHAVGPLAPKS